jgi:hypothetical protein
MNDAVVIGPSPVSDPVGWLEAGGAANVMGCRNRAHAL